MSVVPVNNVDGNALDIHLNDGTLIALRSPFNILYYRSILAERTSTCKRQFTNHLKSITITFRLTNNSDIERVSTPYPLIKAISRNESSYSPVKKTVSSQIQVSPIQTSSKLCQADSDKPNKTKSPTSAESKSEQASSSCTSIKSKSTLTDKTLAIAINLLPKKTLKAELLQHGLATTGNINELQNRLKDHLTSSSNNIPSSVSTTPAAHTPLSDVPEHNTHDNNDIRNSIKTLEKAILHLNENVSKEHHLLEALLLDQKQPIKATKNSNKHSDHADTNVKRIEFLEEKYQMTTDAINNIDASLKCISYNSKENLQISKISNEFLRSTQPPASPLKDHKDEPTKLGNYLDKSINQISHNITENLKLSAITNEYVVQNLKVSASTNEKIDQLSVSKPTQSTRCIQTITSSLQHHNPKSPSTNQVSSLTYAHLVQPKCKYIDHHQGNFLHSNDLDNISNCLQQYKAQFAMENGHSVLSFGERYHYTGSKSKTTRTIPQVLQKLIDSISNEFNLDYTLNSILVNHYPKDGFLSAHSDNESTINPDTSIFTLSIGEGTITFRDKATNQDHKFLAASNSLYVMSRSSQNFFTHRISTTEERFSLTIRSVKEEFKDDSIPSLLNTQTSPPTRHRQPAPISQTPHHSPDHFSQHPANKNSQGKIKAVFVHDSQLNSFDAAKLDKRFAGSKFKAGSYTDLATSDQSFRKLISMPHIDAYVLQLGVNDLRSQNMSPPAAMRHATYVIDKLLQTTSAKIIVSLPSAVPHVYKQHLNEHLTRLNKSLNEWITLRRNNNNFDAVSRLYTVSNDSILRAHQTNSGSPYESDQLHLNTHFGIKLLCSNITRGLIRSFGLVQRKNDSNTINFYARYY